MATIGQRIEKVRVQKNISVKKVCGNQISRSVYNRFANGRADTSTDNLLYLLSILHIGFDELQEEQLGYTDIRKSMIKIRRAFERQHFGELEKIIQSLENMSCFPNDSYDHLAQIAMIVLARAEDKKVLFSENRLVEYLLNVDTWTHYELIMFNNCMFILPIELIEVLLDRSLKHIARFSDNQIYGNEYYRMLLNVIILFMTIGRADLLEKYYQALLTVRLNEDMLFERTFKLFITGIYELYMDNPKGKRKIQQALSVLHICQATGLLEMNHKLLKKLKENNIINL